VGEVSLLVRHNLLRTWTIRLDDIEVVLAHPQALAQCQGWLSKHLPMPSAAPCPAMPKAPAWPPPTRPGRHCQRARRQQFGLHIVAHAIQDEAYNRTRFAIICLPQTLAAPGHRARLHQPGGVGAQPTRRRARPAGAAQEHGVSMTRFESRPARSGQWEYYFYIDWQGHPSQPNVAPPEELQGLCAFYKVLGTYPVANCNST
jgi:chorismate mutase/prephenate dehydratase